MTVYSLYIYRTILFVKINQTKFKRQCDVHSYNTRNKENFIVKKHNKEKYKKCTSYSGVKFINYLPNGIRSENNFVKFKNKLKDYLINFPIYCMDDFYSNKA